MDKIGPIKTEVDYERAITKITAYFENQPEPGMVEGERFDRLAKLIEDYEDRFYPMPAFGPPKK